MSLTETIKTYKIPFTNENNIFTLELPKTSKFLGVVMEKNKPYLEVSGDFSEETKQFLFKISITQHLKDYTSAQLICSFPYDFGFLAPKDILTLFLHLLN